MNAHFWIKLAITVALVLAASALSKKPGVLGAMVASLPITSLLVLGWLQLETHDAQKVAGMCMDIFWFVLGSLAFFPVLAYSIKAGWNPWLCFGLAGIAGFAGMSLVQAALVQYGGTTA